jgi:hypothetical protein
VPALSGRIARLDGAVPSITLEETMKRIATIVASALVLLAAGAFAQEHPEHPKNDEKKAAAETEKPVTMDALADAITAYIAQDAKLKGGYFLVYDAEEKKPLVLTLDKVHKDRLSGLGGGVYFACTDMKNADGVLYDLDFFMKGDADHLETTEVSVHKKAGKPRYGWKEDNGIWKKVKA